MKMNILNVSWIRVKKVARHTKESFVTEVLNNPERNEAILLARRETDPEKKKRYKESLPGVCWNANEFTDDQRHDATAVPGIFSATDYDAKDNPHMGNVHEYFRVHIQSLTSQLHIVWAEETTNHGLHVVSLLPQNATIAQAQQHQAACIGLNHDPACKDIPRLTILGHKDEIYYADWDAIFGEKELEPYTIEVPESEGSIQKANLPILQEKIDEVREMEKHGVKVGDIFDAYVGTQKIPEGERNTTVFAKAHKLMALGLTSEELVALFTPVTNLSQAELRQACRTQPNYVPSDGKLPLELRKIIRQLRRLDHKMHAHGRKVPAQRPLNAQKRPLFHQNIR